MIIRKARLYSTEITIFSIFALVTAIVTFPVIMHFKTFVYARLPGDPNAAIWDFWWTKISWTHGLSYEDCNLIGAPFGLHVQRLAEPAMNYPTLIINMLFGEVAAYNSMVVAGFLLSAITMYYLSYHFTNNKQASMVSGAIFAFCPYHFAQCHAHLGLSNIQWIPLYVLSLIKLYENRTLRNSLFCGLSFSLVVLANSYYGYFMIIFTIVFLLFVLFRNIIRQRARFFRVKGLGMIALSFVFAITLMVPFTLPVVFQQYAGSDPHITSIEEVINFTANSWSYLIPSVDNPIFAPLVEDYVYNKTGRFYPDEHIDYLGYGPLALALLGIVVWLRKRKNNGDIDETSRRIDFAVPLFIVIFIAAIAFSVSPYWDIFGLRINAPTYYLHAIAPMFRTLSRFGVIAMLAVSVLAGIGIKSLLDRTSLKIIKLLIIVLLSGMIFIDFVISPSAKATDVSNIPPAYEWLKTQEGDFTVVEYPIPAVKWWQYYESMFYQRVHEKKLADLRAIPGIEEKDYLYDVANPETWKVLKYLGIKYVIVHADEYLSDNGVTPDIYTKSGLELVKVFPSTLVYEVKTKPSSVFWSWRENSFSPDFWGGWEDYKEWRWTTTDSELMVINCAGRDLYGDLKFNAAALGYTRELCVYINNRLLQKINVEPSAQEVMIEDVFFKIGENSIKFSTESKPDVITSHLQNGDAREATFRFSEFNFEN